MSNFPMIAAGRSSIVNFFFSLAEKTVTLKFSEEEWDFGVV